MNKTIQVEIVNLLASNTAVVIIAGVFIAFLLLEVMVYIRNKKSNHIKRVISPRTKLITAFLAYLFAFAVLYRFHVDAMETVSWRNDVTQKASSYTIYVDGIKVENENIDILSYSKKCIVIDDQAQTILVASTGRN